MRSLMARIRKLDQVLGIDPSSKTIALCELRLDSSTQELVTFRLQKWELGEKSGPDVLDLAWRVLLRWKKSYWAPPEGASYNKRVCCIEAPIVAGPASRNISGTIVQAYMNGVLQASFYGSGYTTFVSPPTQWKAALGLGFNANKQAIDAWLLKEHPDIHQACCIKKSRAAGFSQPAALVADQDLIDAAAIARYAVTALGDD
jgi:hypothetical protein